MSGPTIGNWNKFDANVFKSISGVPDENTQRLEEAGKGGALGSRVADVKAGHLHASTVKKFFLGLLTFGIYNICHGISAKNQRATTAALKEGVSNVHGALSFLSTVVQRDIQKRGFGSNMDNFGMGFAQKAPELNTYTQEDREFLAKANCKLVLVPENSDPVFPSGEFVRTKMGGVEVDIGLCGGGRAKVRIKDGEGRGKDAIIDLPNVEEALYALEKDIVRDTDVFGGDMVEKMLTRYDKRLELEKTSNGANIIGAPVRQTIKNRQTELSLVILMTRYGMSPERFNYLDRDMAKQLAIQATKGNIAGGPELDAHYDKIVSQRHLVDCDMNSLYAKLDEAGDAIDNKIHLAPAAPQAKPGEGRPTEAQKGVHDFAADLILGEDLSEYDKDIGKSGYLDGTRLRNIFAKHHDTIKSLMDARAEKPGETPAALKSLDPTMQNAVVKLLDSLAEQKAKDINCVGKDNDFFLKWIVSDFDREIEREKNKSGQLEVDDLSKKVQFEKAGIGTSPEDAFSLEQKLKEEKPDDEFGIIVAKEELEQNEKAFDYRRHGRANFFAQLDIELGKSIDEAMKGTVQTEVKRMIQNVFPKENPAANDVKSSLDTIVADRASDPQMKLLKQTLDVYFEKMSVPDKRNMMARLVRNTVNGAADGIRFGELLKGAGPILQKMLQGLDPKAFTDPNFRMALDDMRSNLAPIPEKAVKAQFAEMIARSKGEIESITVKNSLGAASVGQTFLCSIKLRGEAESRECVIKMLRPDANLRALREAEVFREVAKGIEGMSKTFEGRLSGIMKELDLTIEAENVKKGLDVYDAGTHKVNKTFNNVSSMRLSDIPGTAPTKGLMVLERAPGVPMDKFLKRTDESIDVDKTTALSEMDNRGAEDAVLNMLDGAEKLTRTYEDTLAKHDALTNLTTIWIREGLFTKTGFYHGDLHAGNIMVPTAEDVRNNVPNGVTMIDFGNTTTLTNAEQKNVIRIIAGAAGNDPSLFLKGLEEMLSADGKQKLADNREAVKDIVTSILAKGTGNDAGKRMTAVFKLLQTKFSIEVPPAISGFQSSQERLAVAMESMLRTMTNAEMARIDVILAAAKKEGVEVPAFGKDVPVAQVFEQKKAAALAYIEKKLSEGITDDVRDRLTDLKSKLDEADTHRPMSMMQCMVAVIKQNILTSLKALGAGSARTVTTNLTNDGIIGNNNGNAGEAKERRFAEFWP